MIFCLSCSRNFPVSILLAKCLLTQRFQCNCVYSLFLPTVKLFGQLNVICFIYCTLFALLLFFLETILVFFFLTTMSCQYLCFFFSTSIVSSRRLYVKHLKEKIFFWTWNFYLVTFELFMFIVNILFQKTVWEEQRSFRKLWHFWQ